ncbi:popeye domain-containing protein 3-like isoform X3 [Liolophura sinensis]|uniref:popeye domain-containing protein 3-like isoform X2 n=1 Tax=Liolophura sinensis TaxID=3198878 RepID=UPI00315989C6
MRVIEWTTLLTDQNDTEMWISSGSGSGSLNYTLAALTPLKSCVTFLPANHIIYHLANLAICVGLFAPSGTYGVLFLHTLFMFGFLLMSVWAWMILCAPDVFSWNFAFMVINGIQMLFITYRIRRIKFCEELEEVYDSLFAPLRVSRAMYKKLTSPEHCTLMTLHPGESYATQSITKTDKLGLLVSGVINVYSSQTFLHHIYERQFIDSPEFESSVTGEEKYGVSIIGATSCRYIFWPRQALEYLLIKEPYLANLMNIIIGRDIATKLYALNDKAGSYQGGGRVDIRLPSLSSGGGRSGQTTRGSSMKTERSDRFLTGPCRTPLDDSSIEDNEGNYDDSEDTYVSQVWPSLPDGWRKNFI